MTEFDELKGAIDVSKGVAAANPLTIMQGLATFFGLETNAAHMQKLVAHEYEEFVFDTLMGHTRRLDDLEVKLHRTTWTMEEAHREQSEKLAQLQGVFDLWKEKVGSLGAKPSDLAAVLEVGFRVWKESADAKKRKFLGNALRNAFNRDRYEEGLTLRLMDLLAQLTYGDIYTLSLAQQNIVILKAAQATPPDQAPKWALWPKPGSLQEDHAKRLEARGLAIGRDFILDYSRRHDRAVPSMNLRGLLLSTELGDRLLDLVAEQEASLGPEVEP